jgi:hypothetical protein
MDLRRPIGEGVSRLNAKPLEGSCVHSLQTRWHSSKPNATTCIPRTGNLLCDYGDDGGTHEHS